MILFYFLELFCLVPDMGMIKSDAGVSRCQSREGWSSGVAV